MSKLVFCLSPLLVFFCNSLLLARQPADAAKETVVWNLDNLECIGGHKVSVVGKPRVIETDQGKAIEFDGREDGLVPGRNPADSHYTGGPQTR